MIVFTPRSDSDDTTRVSSSVENALDRATQITIETANNVAAAISVRRCQSPRAEARQREQHAGRKHHWDRAQEWGGRASRDRTCVPERIRVQGTQALVGDVARSDHARELGIRGPRKQREESLPQPM